jgi:hypothetical protein
MKFLGTCFLTTRMKLKQMNHLSGGELLEIRLLDNHLLDTLAGNQLLNTKFINCSNPVNPGSTGFEQLTLLSSVTYKLKKSIFNL